MFRGWWRSYFPELVWSSAARKPLAITVGGAPTQGAVIYIKGELTNAGEQIALPAEMPAARLAQALRTQNVSVFLQRDPNQEDGLIILQMGPRAD